MEIIYVLTNPVMPNLVKIGRTTNLEERIRSLSHHSGVPVPFECYYACEVEDGDKVEKSLHDAFGDHRTNPKREFFRIDPERVISVLRLVEVKNVTPTDDIVEDEIDRQTLKKEREKRSKFKFSMVNIKPGEVLTFSRDENIIATVVDDTKIEFEGKITSLSGSATQLLRSKFNWTTATAQGPFFWCCDGESLSERRHRMETED